MANSDIIDQDIDKAAEALNAAFTQRYHSLAAYILSAQPFVEPGQESLLRVIREIAEYDRIEAEDIAETIETIGGIAQVVPYHHDVAELNYLSLTFLRNVLVQSLRKQLAGYEKRLAATAPIPLAHKCLSDLCDQMRRQIEKLRA